MTTPDSNNIPATDGGLEKIAQQGRVDYRMVTEDQQLTDNLRAQILADLRAYRDDHPRNSQPLAWGRLAELVGVSQGTLVDVVKGKYKGDTDKVLRKIDQFLADDRARVGRFDFRTTARISVTEAIFGTIRSGIRLNTMPVIIGESGDGKSVHARAFASDRGGVVTVRVDEKHADANGVCKLLVNAIDGLRPCYNHTARRQLGEIKGWLRKHMSTVIVIDEAQKLLKSGLEMLRDIHDMSDPAGRRNIPIVFFGDHDFKKLLFRGRAGERSPISPQTARRMRPVLDIDADCQVDDSGGIYTVEDIVAIVRNQRVKLLSARAVRWMRDLANVRGWGRLGLAMGVLQLAVDMNVPPGTTLTRRLDVGDLRDALEQTFGRSVALEIDDQAGGELLRATA